MRKTAPSCRVENCQMHDSLRYFITLSRRTQPTAVSDALDITVLS